MDMANNMESAARALFPNARLIIGHFHVVKLVIDALQHIRIKQRWEALDQENNAINESTEKNRSMSHLFSKTKR